MLFLPFFIWLIGRRKAWKYCSCLRTMGKVKRSEAKARPYHHWAAKPTLGRYFRVRNDFSVLHLGEYIVTKGKTWTGGSIVTGVCSGDPSPASWWCRDQIRKEIEPGFKELSFLPTGEFTTWMGPQLSKMEMLDGEQVFKHTSPRIYCAL